MSRILAWMAPVAFLPIALTGLVLWRDQAPFIWLSGFFAACL